MMKRVIPKIKCFAFCLFLSMNAFADVTIDGISYSLNYSARTATVTGSSLQDVVVPETIDYDGVIYNVTSITASAFSNNTTIKSFKSSSIATIEMSQVGWDNSWDGRPPLGTFAYATNLTEVYMDNVVTIGAGAFYKATNLQKVYVGNKLRSIGSLSFGSCNNLQYIVIPESISSFYTYSQWRGSTNYNSFYGSSTRIICLKQGIATGSSNQTIYPSSFFSFSSSTTTYNGKVPEVNYTFNGIGSGFQPTEVNQNDMVASAGEHTINLHCTFANNDMSFDVDIPYTYTINPATLTAKVKDASRLYGDGNPEFTSTYTGFINGEDASVVTSNGSYNTTATAKSDVGTYPIKQTGATAQNYVFDYEDGTLTVNKAPLTMTANDKTMTYGSKVPTLDATYEGLKNNETMPAWTTEPTLTTTATPTSRVAQYPIIVSNAVTKNYDLTIHNGTLTIEKAALTAKVDNKSRLYGDTNPQFTLTYTGLKNGETVPEWDQQPSFETAATTLSNVGSYAVSLKNAVAVNYDITPVEGTLTVNKAPLRVTPKDATRKYGEENPKFELLYEGLKNSENMPEWTTEPVITTNATKSSSVGEYTIQVNNAEARNYTLEKGNGTLTITKVPLTVKLLDATRKYGTTNPNFELSYTGLVNDETTPAWTTYPTITTTAGEKSDVGEYPITATGGELKNYEADGIASGVLTVTPASLVVRAQDASRYYFEENPQLNYICTGFVQGDNVSLFTVKPQLSTTATLQSPAGVYPIEVGGAEIKNYQLTYENGQLTVDKRMLTVSTKDYTRAYGEENPEFELLYSGFVNNESGSVLKTQPQATTTATKSSDTGTYLIIIEGGEAINYDFTYVGATLTIEKSYQSLIWNQEFTDVKKYAQIELNATATSGLDVTYTLIEGKDAANLYTLGNKTYLDVIASGSIVIMAQQEGTRNYYSSEKLYKTIEVQGKTVTLTMKDGEQGELRENVISGQSREITILPAKDYKIHSVTYNDMDVTDQLSSDGLFTTAPILEDATLYIVFESTSDAVPYVEDVNPTRISARRGEVVVTNLKAGEQIFVFDIEGREQASVTSNGYSTSIQLKTEQTYIVKAGNKTVKVRL